VDGDAAGVAAGVDDGSAGLICGAWPKAAVTGSKINKAAALEIRQGIKTDFDVIIPGIPRLLSPRGSEILDLRAAFRAEGSRYERLCLL
jgi:hypothetical protein